MKGHVYVLSGASGSGKTTLLNHICSDPYKSELKTIIGPKYSERLSRGDNDDIIHVGAVDSASYDLPYVINNYRYAIDSHELARITENGTNPVVVVSDFRIVRELKQKIPGRVRAIYVSSAIDSEKLRRIQLERLGFRPDQNQKKILTAHFGKVSAAARLGWWDRVSECVSELSRDWRIYATDAESTEIRAQRIRAFHTRYIEHISIFDHVVLNYGEGRPEDMARQLANIMRNHETHLSKKTHPLFVVAAASGAGKGSLMETLNLIGGGRIRVIRKFAKRNEKTNDKRDGTIAVGINGYFPDECDIRWRFHGSEDREGTEYGICSDEVNSNIMDRTPQIVVSNMQAFRFFREIWPQNSHFLYLHRLASLDEMRQFQTTIHVNNPVEAETRIAEITRVYEDYITRISEFDHVLLNTSYLEDLFDQMFRVIENKK